MDKEPDYSMHKIYIPEKVLCAILLNKENLAIGTSTDCQLFTLKNNQPIPVEFLLKDEETVNLCSNKKGTLLGITTNLFIDNYIYNNAAHSLIKVSNLIPLSNRVSIHFLPDNRLFTHYEGNIIIDDYMSDIEIVGEIKDRDSGKSINNVNKNISHHPRKKQFLCHNIKCLYKVCYQENIINPQIRTISAQAEEITSIINNYEDIEWHPITHQVLIRSKYGKIFIGKILKNLNLPLNSFGSPNTYYINMCFHPKFENILVLLTSNGIVEYWNHATKDLLTIKNLPYRTENKDIFYFFSHVTSLISTYLFPFSSSLSFDPSGEKLLVVFEDKCFFGNAPLSHLINTWDNFIKYIIIRNWHSKDEVPHDLRLSIMKLFLRRYLGK